MPRPSNGCRRTKRPALWLALQHDSLSTNDRMRRDCRAAASQHNPRLASSGRRRDTKNGRRASSLDFHRRNFTHRRPSSRCAAVDLLDRESAIRRRPGPEQNRIESAHFPSSPSMVGAQVRLLPGHETVSRFQFARDLQNVQRHGRPAYSRRMIVDGETIKRRGLGDDMINDT